MSKNSVDFWANGCNKVTEKPTKPTSEGKFTKVPQKVYLLKY